MCASANRNRGTSSELSHPASGRMSFAGAKNQVNLARKIAISEATHWED